MAKTGSDQPLDGNELLKVKGKDESQWPSGGTPQFGRQR